MFANKIIQIIIILAVVAIFLAVVPAMGIAIPAIVIRIGWIVVVAALAIIAIQYLVSLWNSGKGGPPA